MEDPNSLMPEGNNMFPSYGNNEADISNIVGQIDPKMIIDNLSHALKGEHYEKESATWILNESKEALVNDSCRGAIISYLDGILTNNTTMAFVDEKRLSFLMESVIETITRLFIVNLEKFGFVPPGEHFKDKVYYNKGSPDSAKMTLVAHMIYKVCYLVFSRALGGTESRRIFKSLTMSDGMNYGGEQKKSWVGKMFGR